MARILLVRKVPLLHRLDRESIDRLSASGVMRQDRLEASAAMQEATLVAVRACLDAGDQVDECLVHQLRPGDGGDVDLVLTVGGDGTVFAAGNLATSAAYLTVNSDPERSVGHYTRFTRDTIAAGLAAWHTGKAWLEAIPRLQLEVDSRHWFVLNDALFTSTNPAAMSRYQLEADDQREYHRSSGVWIATGAGSTAAIRSAGAEPVPAHEPALLWRVREPFPATNAYQLLSGHQHPPRRLRLTPGIPGMALYLDGPNLTIPVPPGTHADFTLAVHPLRLLRI